MQSASREALQATEGTFQELTVGMDAATLAAAADELAAVARLLSRELVLRRHLAEKSGHHTERGLPSDTVTAKLSVIDSLFGGKVGAQVLELLKDAVSQRWSTSRDLVVTLDRFARLSVLIEAERASRIESVEDELFRFGRTLDANPRLASLLGDSGTPADGRVTLLHNVLGASDSSPSLGSPGKVSTYTMRLLEQTVRQQQSTHFAAVVAELAELAAARRGESVAHVVAAAPLTDAQRTRLAEVLSRIYGRTISVQLDLDPEILGGLRITVGDEIIDGTIASRLAAAASQLPR